MCGNAWCVSVCEVDGFEQHIAPSGMKIVDILDEVERVARWRGSEAHNPFKELREKRKQALGL